MARSVFDYRAFKRNAAHSRPHSVPFEIPFTKFVISPTRDRKAARLKKKRA